MAKVLVAVSLRFFGNHFTMVSTLGKESILKVIDSLYYFGPEVVKGATIDQHQVFYYDKHFQLSFR